MKAHPQWRRRAGERPRVMALAGRFLLLFPKSKTSFISSHYFGGGNAA